VLTAHHGARRAAGKLTAPAWWARFINAGACVKARMRRGSTLAYHSAKAGGLKAVLSLDNVGYTD
jgi:hypothetical protein